MTALKNKANNSLLEEKAEEGLELTSELKRLGEILETNKEWFRGEADGETLDVVVDGLGKVQVKKPSEGGIFTSTTLNTAAFDALDSKTKHDLVSKGIVKVTSGSKAPSKAAVVFTLNV